MGLTCGIVGLPNVGKSTTFNALTKAGAKVENYPFCTIEPNSGVVEVPDKRLERIASKIATKKIIPTTVEFIDIAGLVKGANKGEGLGNKFLSHIRNVNVIIHVVRCFEDNDIAHVDGNIDAIRDIETIHTELILSDLDAVQRRESSIRKLAQTGNKDALREGKLLSRLTDHLSDGNLALTADLNVDEWGSLPDVSLITSKPILFCCNVNEGDVVDGNDEVKKVIDYAKNFNADVVWLCAEIEAEIAEIDDDAERHEFLGSLGLKQSGLEILSKKGYDLLGLQTYFTAGEKEIRAWTVQKGAKAPQAAGVIHTDFERGFIRAETFHFNDLMELENEKNIRENGRLRVEGKEYVVKDGDIMHFLFNV